MGGAGSGGGVIRLEQLRLDARMTPEELGAKVGMTGRGIRYIESSGSTSAKTLWKLADALDVKPSELLLPAVPPESSRGAAA
jgi:transcriptional regulator with XRE-family HTH domain